jgi:polyisoprenoid-binding protein YceI
VLLSLVVIRHLRKTARRIRLRRRARALGRAFALRAGMARGSITALIIAGALCSHALAQAGARDVQLNGGSVTFEVSTNVFSTTVRGQTNTVTGSTRLRDNGSTLRLEQLEAVVPVSSLRTGIKLRDEHMRKYIFETPDGQAPDVRFSAESVDCTPSSGGYACSTSGALSIRGASKPFTIELKVTKSGEAFHVTGDGKVALSTYGIERPSQFGVRTEDEVKIHVDLNARNIATAAARVR